MKKLIYLAACGLVTTFCAGADVITPEQALQRIATYGGHKLKGKAEVNRTLLHTYPSAAGDAAVYVFGNNSGKGYMLLSADDSAAPVLGYSDTGKFDFAAMPPQLEAWLAGYVRQVEYARQHGLPVYRGSGADDRAVVEPLMSTIWNQSEPFNLLTPKLRGVSCPTGCVATAMAQVMKFWNYPDVALGTGTITNPATGRKESMQLGEENFAWTDMIDSYNGDYTDAQAHAVAYLMKACGYASQMRYTASVSGAFSMIAGKAMINNFSYNPNLRYYNRDYFTATEWDSVVYNEISHGRPVLYGAQSTSGGHEFVCDGYSGDGFYHFNWGWGGMSDGYFILDSLNPGAVGVGGGAGGGFNYSQDILVGVQPEAEDIYQPRLVQMGDLTATPKGSRITIKLDRYGMTGQWVNTGLEDMTVTIGVGIESIDGAADSRFVVSKSTRVAAPKYQDSGDGSLAVSYSGVNGQFSFEFPKDLPDGKYKVSVATRSNGAAESDWKPVLTQAEAYNYFIATKSGDSISVETFSNAKIILESADLASPLYYGSIVKFSITMVNDSEKELTQGFYPVLATNGRDNMIGDGIVVTLQPHETITREFTTQFRLLSGSSAPSSRRTYDLRWLDPNTNQYYDKSETVTMNVNTANPSLTINRFVIDGEDMESAIVPGAGRTDVYQITDIENVDFKLSLTNDRGFFGYPLYLAVFDIMNFSESIMSSIFEPLVYLEAGDSCDLDVRINMSVGKLRGTYAGLLFYQGPKGMVQVQSADHIYFKLVGGSDAVDEIEAEENAEPVYYNMQGIEVANPEKGSLVIKKQGSRIEKVVIK